MKIRTSNAVSLSLLTLLASPSIFASSTFGVASEDPLVRRTISAIRLACPGLDKYSPAFKNIRVEENFRTSLVFDIQNSSLIPEAYMAGGHTCYVEIDPKGSDIFIEKQACKSVCLDQFKTPSGQLKIGLAQGDQ